MMTKMNRKKQAMNKKNHKDEKKQTDGLPGFPGYRTREGRSGYDYIDSELEYGHMAGVFLRHFFTVSIRTRNPVILIFLAVLGIFCLFPAVLAIVETVDGNTPDWMTWTVVGVICIPGFLALANLLRLILVKNK